MCLAIFAVEVHYLELCLSRVALALHASSTGTCCTIWHLTSIDGSLYNSIDLISVRRTDVRDIHVCGIRL